MSFIFCPPHRDVYNFFLVQFYYLIHVELAKKNLCKVLKLLYSVYCQNQIERNPVGSNSGEPPKCDPFIPAYLQLETTGGQTPGLYVLQR